MMNDCNLTTYVVVSENLRATFSLALFFDDDDSDNADTSTAPSLADSTADVTDADAASLCVLLLITPPADRMSSSFATCLESTLERMLPIGVRFRMVLADQPPPLSRQRRSMSCNTDNETNDAMEET
jgi:hypothetical protein